MRFSGHGGQSSPAHAARVGPGSQHRGVVLRVLQAGASTLLHLSEHHCCHSVVPVIVVASERAEAALFLHDGSAAALAPL
jgi:hypothetical protein